MFLVRPIGAAKTAQHELAATLANDLNLLENAHGVSECALGPCRCPRSAMKNIVLLIVAIAFVRCKPQRSAQSTVPAR